MRRPVRREDRVRQLLGGPHPPVPAGLAQRAAKRGGRVLRIRRTVRALALAVLSVAVAAFVVWAVTAQPWRTPPAGTAPPLGDW